MDFKEHIAAIRDTATYYLSNKTEAVIQVPPVPGLLGANTMLGSILDDKIVGAIPNRRPIPGTVAKALFANKVFCAQFSRGEVDLGRGSLINA